MRHSTRAAFAAVLAAGSALAVAAPAPAGSSWETAAPVVTYTNSVRGSCQGHGYTLTGTFQYDPNTNRRRGIGGSFHGDNWTQVIHDFQVGATSSGGSALSPTTVVDSIAGSQSVAGKWGTGVQVSVYMRVYRTLYRCAGGIGA